MLGWDAYFQTLSWLGLRTKRLGLVWAQTTEVSTFKETFDFERDLNALIRTTETGNVSNLFFLLRIICQIIIDVK